MRPDTSRIGASLKCLLKRSVSIVALVMIVGLSLGAQAPFDQTFPPDVPAPQRFRTNRTSYSAIMDLLRPSRPRATQAMLDQLETLPLESIYGALGDYRTNYARAAEEAQPGDVVVAEPEAPTDTICSARWRRPGSGYGASPAP